MLHPRGSLVVMIGLFTGCGADQTRSARLDDLDDKVPLDMGTVTSSETKNYALDQPHLRGRVERGFWQLVVGPENAGKGTV